MLVIDSRENSVLSRLVEMYAKELAIKTNKEWIEVGDYVVGNVCFEAKNTQDFLQSVLNKRLWNQIDNMDRAYDVNVIMIYGNIEEAIRQVANKYAKDLPRESRQTILHNKFYGALGRIILDTDAKPIFAPSEAIAAKMITTVAKMQPVDRPVISPSLIKRITTDDIRVDMLSSIKGVSENKAKKLLETFGSIMELGECKSSEIAFLEGFGEVVGQRIIDILNSEEKVRL